MGQIWTYFLPNMLPLWKVEGLIVNVKSWVYDGCNDHTVACVSSVKIVDVMRHVAKLIESMVWSWHSWCTLTPMTLGNVIEIPHSACQACPACGIDSISENGTLGIRGFDILHRSLSTPGHLLYVWMYHWYYEGCVQKRWASLHVGWCILGQKIIISHIPWWGSNLEETNQEIYLWVMINSSMKLNIQQQWRGKLYVRAY